MSYSSDPYDPGAPEGEVTGRGQYMTKRDLKHLLFGVALLGAIMYPVYVFMLHRSESSRCTQNMSAIQEALSLYATEHDGRYPPIDRSETPESFTPNLGDTGHPYTWASDVSNYMTGRASFKCPSAKPEELVTMEDPKTNKTFLPLSYGMYAPYGCYLTSLVESPDQTIIVAETSNGGTNGTFDPTPFKSATGEALPDGFVIGWNDNNEESSANSKYVTRLAFPGTTDGHFVKSGDGRHGDSIHMLTASGELVNGSPNKAAFHDMTGKRVNSAWTVPPISQIRR